MKPYRVLFHLDESTTGKFILVLKNIENLLADIGDDSEIELVALGEGTSFLYRTPNHFSDRIAQLAARGVRFAVCANSLRQQNLTKEFFLDVAEVVPAGVGELVRKQAEGWTYIKP